MKKLLFTVIIAGLLIYVSGCSSVTDIEGTWKKPATVAKKYNKIVVLGLYNNVAKRSTVENAIVSEFRLNGINAVAGTNILPHELIDTDKDGKVDQRNKDIIVEKLKKEGIDGAFVFKVEDVKESETYVPGTSYYAPNSGYYPFYNYYWSSYDMVYSPGYYTKTTNVIFVSNFYNVAQEQLIWSTQSKTLNPTSLSDFAKSYSKAVVEDFITSGVIKK